MQLRSCFFFFSAVAASFGACECGKPPPTPAGELCGQGAIDGTDYAVVSDETELVIGVRKVDAFGCGALHSHVVLAKSATFEYDLDGGAAGDVVITVPISDLDPDDPDLRKKYLPEGENQPLSDGDRESIRGSVAEEVKAEEFADLIFTMKELSTLDGEGTATLEVDIAGAKNDVEMAYTAKKDGDKITVTGDKIIIPGGPHGIPRNALGFCVSPDMELSFTVVLEPGTTECEKGGEVTPPFEPTFFDDQECGEVGYNVVRNDVIGPRCMGCHGGLLPDGSGNLRGGATEPLVEWEDFRVDSVRNQGAPLYEKAHEYVNLPSGDPEVLSMPPAVVDENSGLPESTALTAEELALFNSWIDGGARNVQCADDVEPKTFTRVEPSGDCAGGTAIHFADAQDDHNGAAAADFFAQCSYCHSAGNDLQAPSAPLVASFDANEGIDVIDFTAGADDVTHPFYVTADGAPLSFWNASVHRVEDGSMFPGILDPNFGGFDPETDDSFQAFKAWVEAGYCE